MSDLERILSIIRELSPNQNVDVHENSPLLEEKIIDSFDVVNLVYELNEAFSIEIGALELMPENFETPQAILKLVQTMRGV